MDISKILSELKAERDQIEEAITKLGLLAHGRGRKRGRPPAWMAEVASSKRGGQPPGSTDPGSQPPPAAARIAGRLDRAIPWKKPA